MLSPAVIAARITTHRAIAQNQGFCRGQSLPKDLTVGVSVKDMVHLKNRYMAALANTKRLRHKAGEGVRDAVHVAEVALGAGAFGWWAGKRAADATATDAPNVFGIPADLAAGIVLYGAAWFGVGGGEEHFKALGDGALGAYFSTLGYAYGHGTKASLWRAPKVLGSHTTAGDMLTADDLAKLAARS